MKSTPIPTEGVAAGRPVLLLALAWLLPVACEARHQVGAGSDADGAVPGPGDADGSGAGGTAGISNLGGGGVAGAAPLAQDVPLRISGRAAILKMTERLWMAAPDDALTAEAVDGTYKVTADLLPLARRIVADSRSTMGVGAFYRWWLQLDGLATVEKDPVLFPAFTTGLAQSMATETQTFGVKVTLEGDGFFSTLMLAPYSYLDESLAGIYGVSGVSGAAFRQVSLDVNRRAGVLSQPALAAMASSFDHNLPTRRGSFVLDRFLCSPYPAPPPGESLIPALPPNTSLRTAVIEPLLSDTPCASACHRALDPVGFAFEGLDGIGRTRDRDNGAAIDTSGMLGGRAFTGVGGLAELLAADPDAQRCMTQQWLEFALGRPLSGADAASIDRATQAFHASGHRLRELIAAVLTSDAFLSP